MPRKMIDCRDNPDQNICTSQISSDTEEELLQVARDHALGFHGYPDHPDTWAAVKGMIKDA